MKKNRLKKVASDIYRIFKNSFINFSTNRPVQLAGTTAYFAVFSIVPAILTIISVFGIITGNAAIRDKIFEDMEQVIGSDSTKLLQQAIDNYNVIENSTVGTILSVLIFIVSATALFSELQNSVNYIWRVKVRSSFRVGVFNLIKIRLFSFAVILGLGFFFFISVVVDASIGLLREFLTSHFSENFIVLIQTLNLVLAIGVVTIFTAFIYRFLPDVHIEWSAAWFGAGVISVFYATARILLSVVFRNSEMGDFYGAAGSIVVILVWVFIVSIIFYFGVELTHQFSLYYGHNNYPRNYAGTFEIHSVE